jgi:hypothetical protein
MNDWVKSGEGPASLSRLAVMRFAPHNLGPVAVKASLARLAVTRDMTKASGGEACRGLLGIKGGR